MFEPKQFDLTDLVATMIKKWQTTYYADFETRLKSEYVKLSGYEKYPHILQ
ncbi:unnamed protein product, partial [Nesidiocoris tenuis]